MKDRYLYAKEKLLIAVEALATGPGDVRSRLKKAYWTFNRLKAEQLPPQMQEDWRWVLEQMTNRGPLLDQKGKVMRDSVENTMCRIKNRTGAKIAKKIFRLYWELNNNHALIRTKGDTECL